MNVKLSVFDPGLSHNVTVIHPLIRLRRIGYELDLRRERTALPVLLELPPTDRREALLDVLARRSRVGVPAAVELAVSRVGVPAVVELAVSRVGVPAAAELAAAPVRCVRVPPGEVGATNVEEEAARPANARTVAAGCSWFGTFRKLSL